MISKVKIPNHLFSRAHVASTIAIFPTVPRWSLRIPLSTKSATTNQSELAYSWNWFFIPLLCLFLSSVHCARLWKGNTQGIILSMQGFRNKGMSVLYSSSCSAVPGRCCHLTRRAAAWHFGSSLFLSFELYVLRDLSRRAVHWHHSQTWKHNEIKFHSDLVGIFIAEHLR